MGKEKEKSKRPKWLSYLVVLITGFLLGFILYWKLFCPGSVHPFMLSTISFGGTIVDTYLKPVKSGATPNLINNAGERYTSTVDAGGRFVFSNLVTSKSPHLIYVVPTDPSKYVGVAYYLRALRSNTSISSANVFYVLPTPTTQPKPVFNLYVYKDADESTLMGLPVTIINGRTNQTINTTTNEAGMVSTPADFFVIGDILKIAISNATGTDANFTLSTSQLPVGSDFLVVTDAFVTPTR